MTVSLVTGAVGFVGSHVCDHLIKMGHKVVAVDDLSGGDIDNLPLGTFNDNGSCKFIETSYGNRTANFFGAKRPSMDYVFDEYKPEYVYHFGAYASEGLSHHIRQYIYENNVVATANLINAALNAGTVKRFVFTSSVAVYGHRAYRATERDQVEPIDPYGIGKLATELDLKAAQEYFGLPYTIFRPHNIFGPRQSMNDPFRNVVAIFIRQCLAGEPMTIYGDGLQTRAFTYVDDVAQHIARCVDLPSTENETYNIGAPVSITLLELAQEVAKACGVECHYRCLPERKEAQDATPSHNKFVRDFDVKSFTSLQVGLAKMVEYARSAKPHNVMSPKIEVERNLPVYWQKK